MVDQGKLSFKQQVGGALNLQRHSLKLQAAELLREQIITGVVPPGTKLVERDVAEKFGISRAPARDALMLLEKEGLVVSKTDARYVIELTERQIREMYEIRAALESLAVALATKNMNPTNRSALEATLEKMKKAMLERDFQSFTQADSEIHALIWKQADNLQLESMLHTMLGPIRMFIVNHAGHYHWEEALELHLDLVKHVCAGDVVQAEKSINRHMDNSRERALGYFESQSVKD